MDVSRAQLSNLGDSVSLVDPSFPWEVLVRLAPGAGQPEVLELHVIADPDDPQPITSTALAQIPVRQLASVAASAMAGEDEAQYRMLAVPRPQGSRSWPRDHFQRVARVASWARRVGRPGGAAVAVAEFWGVNPRTARRWLRQALALEQAGDRP